MSVLVIAAHDEAKLDPVTARAVHGAAMLGEPVDVLVAGGDIKAVAFDAARLAGIAQVRFCENSALARQPAESLATLICALAGEYRVILAPAAAALSAALARASAMLDRPMLSGVTQILAPDRFARPIHAGMLIETVAMASDAYCLTLRASAFPPCVAQDPAPVATLPAPAFAAKARWIGEESQPANRSALETAPIVIGCGRGLAGAHGVEMAERLAAALGAALGATRAAVDAGILPNACQIGQNGRKIAPGLYLAVGISGAIQHAAGFRDARIVAAINRDPEAPIFQIADIGLVGDLFEALPELILALNKSDH